MCRRKKTKPLQANYRCFADDDVAAAKLVVTSASYWTRKYEFSKNIGRRSTIFEWQIEK